VDDGARIGFTAMHPDERQTSAMASCESRSPVLGYRLVSTDLVRHVTGESGVSGRLRSTLTSRNRSTLRRWPAR